MSHKCRVSPTGGILAVTSVPPLSLSLGRLPSVSVLISTSMFPHPYRRYILQFRPLSFALGRLPPLYPPRCLRSYPSCQYRRYTLQLCPFLFTSDPSHISVGNFNFYLAFVMYPRTPSPSTFNTSRLPLQLFNTHVESLLSMQFYPLPSHALGLPEPVPTFHLLSVYSLLR